MTIIAIKQFFKNKIDAIFMLVRENIWKALIQRNVSKKNLAEFKNQYFRQNVQQKIFLRIR